MTKATKQVPQAAISADRGSVTAMSADLEDLLRKLRSSALTAHRQQWASSFRKMSLAKARRRGKRMPKGIRRAPHRGPRW